MSFLDSAFLFSFLPITLLLFGVAGRIYGPTAACAVLAMATLVFCLPYGWPFWTVVVVSALINHAAFFALLRPSLIARTRLRWYILLAAIILNLGLLVVIKYGIVFDAIPGAMPVFAAIAAAFPVTVCFLRFSEL